MGALQLLQQGGLLEDVELSGAVAGQKLADRVRGLAGPDVGPQRVQSRPPRGLDPLISVDEYKLAQLAGHDHDGQKLAVTQQRVGQVNNLARSLDAGVGVEQIQIDDLDVVYGDGLGHNPALPASALKVPRVISLQDGAFAQNSS